MWFSEIRLNWKDLVDFVKSSDLNRCGMLSPFVTIHPKVELMLYSIVQNVMQELSGSNSGLRVSDDMLPDPNIWR